MSRTEEHLIKAIGSDELKDIGQEIAKVIMWHGLHKSPDLCRELFAYMSEVIVGWNRV